ncbi:trans-Golgi network integral membrane protein 1-like [Thrips palmi]|uniref:Trans-Golgi network integral membrane protein 1-like n=1 Tax=Thrips palmi TaxID=161013 RepID=A0A6P8ZZ72_THRPL|nr:trans-Golgi network integral membrane protein 1-like [Thrips palmi]
MTDLTSGYVRHVAMLTKLLIGIYLLSVVNGKSVSLPQTASESTVVEKIIKERCKFSSSAGSLTFPPANLQIPDKCSKLSLSSQQAPDDLSSNIDYFLCVALLDSTERLCHITKGNLDFAKRVSEALTDSLQSMMTDDGDDTFCKEMNIIDPDAKYPPAKVLYDRIRQKQSYCAAICVGMGDKETAQREPICKSIQFAHQQIHAAIELQTNFNNQGGLIKEREENPVDTKAVRTPGSNLKQPVLDESQAPVVSQTSQRANAQGTPDESRMASNTDAGSNSKPSEVQSSIRNLPANPVALHAVEAAQAVQPVQAVQAVDPDPKLSATSPSKNDNIKVTDKKVPVLPAETNENIPALPAETNENEKASGSLAADKTELDSPNLAQKSEEHTEDLKVDGNQNRNDPAEADEIPPQTEDNDGQDDLLKQEPFDGEDDESMLGNGALEANRDAAEKPPPIEKKVPSAPLLSSQQKTPQASMMGNFEEAEDSHFFAYFMSLSGLCILSYLVYHNKRKIIAMAVEGKKSRNTGRRRPNSASYHKLDSNLEEAMSSNLASTNSYVIY